MKKEVIAALLLAFLFAGCVSSKKVVAVEESLELDGQGNTPLMQAVIKNQESKIRQELADKRYFSSEYKFLNAQNHNGDTVIHLAVQNRNLKILTLILVEGIDLDVKNNAGDTALHIAVENNDLSIVEMLVQEHCDINAVNRFGATPLILAAKNGSLEIVEFLVSQKADKSRQDYARMTYEDYLVPYRKTTEKNLTSLKEGNIPAVGSLDSTHYRIVFGSFSDTPLLVAVKNQNRPTVLKLLKEGVAVDSETDSNGNTALMYAVHAQNGMLVKTLLEKGANVNASNNMGQTPLHCAVSIRAQTIVGILLTHGAEVNAKDDSGNTALSISIQNGLVNMVETLLDAGANPNIKFKNNNSILLQACLNKDYDMVLAIINSVRNIDYYYVNAMGKTALDIAKEQRSTDIVQLIESKM